MPQGHWRLLLLLLGLPQLLYATEPEQSFIPNRAHYPGLYLNLSAAHTTGDKSFDATGEKRDSALPTVSDDSALPRTAFNAQFTWFLALLQDEQTPFFSTRLHRLRATLGYVRTSTKGQLNNFINNNQLQNNSSGVDNVRLEFGSYLFGTQNWQNGQFAGASGLLNLGVDLPSGAYHSNAPTNAGNNTFSTFAEFKLHWQPAARLYFDTGLRYTSAGSTQEPAFGGLTPANAGDTWQADLAIALRLTESFSLSAFADYANGNANQYRNPRFAPNAPEAPAGRYAVTVPGVYTDQGTERTRVGLSLHGMLSDNVQLSLTAAQPVTGKSGQFLLPYQFFLDNCNLTDTCELTATPGPSVLVDGYGAARVFASPHFQFTVTWHIPPGQPVL